MPGRIIRLENLTRLSAAKVTPPPVWLFGWLLMDSKEIHVPWAHGWTTTTTAIKDRTSCGAVLPMPGPCLMSGVIALMTLGMTSPVLALTMGWVFLLELMVVTVHSMLFSPLATVFMECTPSVIQLAAMIKQAPSMHTMWSGMSCSDEVFLNQHYDHRFTEPFQSACVETSTIRDMIWSCSSHSFHTLPLSQSIFDILE